MNPNSSFFENHQQCEYCHRALPESYQKSLCPACEDLILFQQVKEFIRGNNVNEYEVADHFQIPVRRVKEWIREGRIEYKQVGSGVMSSSHCQRCGSPVSFGTLCPKCIKLINQNGRGYGTFTRENDNRMRFFDKDSE